MISVIPAIDLIGGQCVRLSQGDYARKTVYDAEPVQVAERFAAAGAQRLHLVDLDGAKAGKPVNLEVLRAITGRTDLQVDFSGGLRTVADADAAFDAGAAFIGVGSLAVKHPDEFQRWIGRYGAARILLGADVRGTQVAVHGWESTSSLELMPFLEAMQDLGIRDVFCTDIAQDGMLAGPALDLYAAILGRFPELRLIASGGVRNLADICSLEAIGCSGAIVGKAIYEGHLGLDELVALNPVA